MYAEATHDGSWQTTMEGEIRALIVNETWDLVDPPRHCKPIRYEWVYKVKYNVDGYVNQYKARLVAKGYAQTHNIDYDENFAQVEKMKKVKCVAGGSNDKGVASPPDG